MPFNPNTAKLAEDIEVKKIGFNPATAMPIELGGKGKPLTSFEKEIFPTASRHKSEGFSPVRVGKGVLDVLGLPGRIAAASRDPKLLEQSGATILTPEAEKIKGKSKFLSPKGIAGTVVEMAGDPTLPISYGLKGAGNLVKRAGASMGGISKEAFEQATTKTGRKQMEKLVGQEYNLGKKIERIFSKPYAYIPETKVVDDAISEMDKIPISNMVNALRSSLVPNAKTTGAIAANKKINNLINMIEETTVKPASKILNSAGVPAVPKQLKKITHLSPEAYRNLRMQLDEDINWKAPSAEYLGKAMMRARMAGMNDLILAAKEAGQDAYIPAMKSMSNKLKVFEKIKEKAGKNPEAFISHLFGSNKTEFQNLMKELEQVTGGSFLKEAKIMKLAKEFGPEGKVGLIPRQMSGRSALGGIGTIVGTQYAQTPLQYALAAIPTLLSSPGLTTRATGALRTGGKAINKIAPSAYVANPISSAIDRRKKAMQDSIRYGGSNE